MPAAYPGHQGQPTEYSDPTQPAELCGRTLNMMRIVFELLGLVGPDPARKEPVAVPAWAPYAVAAVIAIAVTGLGVLVHVFIAAMV
jgi:hypothetical protein